MISITGFGYWIKNSMLNSWKPVLQRIFKLLHPFPFYTDCLPLWFLSENSERDLNMCTNLPYPVTIKSTIRNNTHLLSWSFVGQKRTGLAGLVAECVMSLKSSKRPLDLETQIRAYTGCSQDSSWCVTALLGLQPCWLCDRVLSQLSGARYSHGLRTFLHLKIVAEGFTYFEPLGLFSLLPNFCSHLQSLSDASLIFICCFKNSMLIRTQNYPRFTWITPEKLPVFRLLPEFCLWKLFTKMLRISCSMECPGDGNLRC